ncbi:spore coat protein CotH, partial [Streptomyces sp. YIM 103828]
FKEDGTKDWIKADLVIDGVYLNDVGIRLKGNSTLMSLRGNKGMPGGGNMPPGAPQGEGAGRQAQDGRTGGAGGGDAETGAPGGGAGPGGAGGRAGGPGGMVQYDLSAEKPEELPWLVKIDEY